MPWYDYGAVVTPGFVADISSMWRSFGRQVDWADVSAGYVNPITGRKEIAGGTLMAVKADGTMIPRADVTGDETTTEILIGPALEGALHHAKTGYGTYLGGVIYQNLLPEAEDASFATWIGELATAGLPFVWLTYADDSIPT